MTIAYIANPTTAPARQRNPRWIVERRPGTANACGRRLAVVGYCAAAGGG